MRSRLDLLALGLVLALVGAAPAAAEETYVDGLRAYDGGDYATTVRIWRELAEEGDPMAQLGLAGLYRQGSGVPRDLGEAARLYRAAALQGNSDAQINLARLYLEGAGVGRDPVKAHAWLTLAAEQDRGWAKRRLQELESELSEAELARAEREAAALRER